MNTAAINYRLIKLPLIAFIASLLVSMTLFFGLTVLLDASRKNHQQTNQSVSIDKQSLQTRLEGNALYAQLQEKYRRASFSQAHQPDKLMWMEQLQWQAKRLALPALTYNIRIRQADSEFNAAFTDGFGVFATPIEIKLGLVHEGQLLQLDDQLSAAGLGSFSFEYCSLKLNEKWIKFLPKTDNIHADCLLKWFEIARTEVLDAALAEGVSP
jgi:hypothetical protein